MVDKLNPALLPPAIERREEKVLTREDIFACTDEQQLRAWYTEHTDLAEEITLRLQAEREGMGEFANLEWMRAATGKVAALLCLNRWTEKRLLELGFHVPYPPTDPRVREIRDLHRRMDKMRKELRSDQRGEKVPA